MRAVDRDDVHMREHLVEAFPVCRFEGALDVFGDRTAVVVMHREAKAFGAAGERHADPAHADDAKTFAPDAVAELRDRTPTGPGAAADQPFAFGEAARHRE